MSLFDSLNPLRNVTPRFTEEQLEEIIEWFDENAKPLLTVNEGEPINVISIEQLETFFALKKYHRRNYHYPVYGEIMQDVEFLKMQTVRVLTKEQFIYILDKYIITPDIKHEMKLAFRVFDTEKRNFLEVDDIHGIVIKYGDVFNEDEVRELLRDMNVRGDGNIYYEDFVESIFSVAPELYQLKVEYLYEDPDEDPSVPPLPEPVVEETPPPPPPPPPPQNKKGAAAAKAKGKKK